MSLKFSYLYTLPYLWDGQAVTSAQRWGHIISAQCAFPNVTVRLQKMSIHPWTAVKPQTVVKPELAWKPKINWRMSTGNISAVTNFWSALGWLVLYEFKKKSFRSLEHKAPLSRQDGWPWQELKFPPHQKTCRYTNFWNINVLFGHTKNKTDYRPEKQDIWANAHETRESL